VNRRLFLRLGAFSPALIALRDLPLGGIAPALAAERGAPAVLDEDLSDVLLAVVERMVDTGVPEAPKPREIGTLAAIEGVLAQLEGDAVDALRLALRAVDWWPAIFEGQFRRFRSLTAEEQDASLEGWRQSSISARRSVFYALRNLAMLGYWSQDATWGLIGYGGPWIGKRA
jgi:hypothetical protein